jgi:hypothetical protein
LKILLLYCKQNVPGQICVNTRHFFNFYLPNLPAKTNLGSNYQHNIIFHYFQMVLAQSNHIFELLLQLLSREWH